MKPLIIIQARTGSRRLPAKALINFRGKPLVVIAARRAGTRGHDVVIATSEETSDDMLAATAIAEGFRVVRGSLNDVLARFYDAIVGVSDDTIVLRLTGDNIVPDGDLIAEIVESFEQAGADYMTTGTNASGLPYGVSIEIMRAKHLRAAQAHATTTYEREHVTPWIRQHYAVHTFQRYQSLELDRFRLTIDSLSDLLSMDRVFPQDRNPDDIPWLDIVKRAHLGLFQPTQTTACSDLVLGTAQLGMPYGINNTTEMTSDIGEEMICRAIADGVQFLDTARAYGRSEHIIGSVWAKGWDDHRCRVITKLSPLADWHADDQAKGVSAAAESSLLASCEALGQAQLDTVLLHRLAHWQAWDGAVARLLRTWVKAGRIKHLGASIQSPEELDAVLEFPELNHVQMPYNILDHRWDDVVPKLERVRNERGLTVHVRSALLQGLLMSDDLQKWQRAGHADGAAIRNWLRKHADQYTQSDVAALCLNWIRGLPWVDGVVVGMDNVAQLQSNLLVFSAPALPPDIVDTMKATRPHLSLKTLDPAQWSPAQ